MKVLVVLLLLVAGCTKQEPPRYSNVEALGEQLCANNGGLKRVARFEIDHHHYWYTEKLDVVCTNGIHISKNTTAYK